MHLLKINIYGYEEDGNPPVLGTGNTQFDSEIPDVAKNTRFKIGDLVRLQRNIQFGNVQIRKTTKGTVRGVSGGGFMSKPKYTVAWHVSGQPVIEHVEADLSFCQVM